jgi:hypothetical protein
MTIGWYLDNVETTYIRTYNNILDILGNISGLYNLLYFIAFFIVQPIATSQCYIRLIDNIFDLPDITGREKPKVND